MPWFAPPFRVVLAAPPAAEGACAAASSSPAGRIRGCEAALLRCIDGGGRRVLARHRRSTSCATRLLGLDESRGDFAVCGGGGEGNQNCTRCYNLLLTGCVEYL